MGKHSQTWDSAALAIVGVGKPLQLGKRVTVIVPPHQVPAQVLMKKRKRKKIGRNKKRKRRKIRKKIKRKRIKRRREKKTKENLRLHQGKKKKKRRKRRMKKSQKEEEEEEE